MLVSDVRKSIFRFRNIEIVVFMQINSHNTTTLSFISNAFHHPEDDFCKYDLLGLLRGFQWWVCYIAHE